MVQSKNSTDTPLAKQGFFILRDTREQTGWEFQKRSPILGTKSATLKTGDYTIEGLEDLFVVERKRNTSELANNLTSDWARFERELERLEAFQFPFLVCEFTLKDIIDYPKGSGIPKSKWRYLKIRGSFLLRKILQIETTYKTRVVFAGENGKEFVRSLCKRIYEQVNE